MAFLRKHGLWIVVVVALLVLRSQRGGFSPEELDAHCQQLMEEGKSAEALAWSREATDDDLRTIYEYDNDRTLEIIEEIYKLGAAKVTAVDIDVDPDFGETTDILIVTLPENPTQRADLLQYESQLAQWTGVGGTSDRGQKYLMLWWD
ncbi:hypothetical protein C5Y96_10410 [Blastopirellula marina]|uniref:Uncharacterized protein n=1 Tax=Blastopirellula marina TaxID=124 RepID=A0A2S8FM94_9BACT|nr:MULTISPECIES: hypothetical protein [Pirellulaceae]PQO33257.1 hypothetical protein C5Y96_10410 [Blastopirellula marina]RCS52346.1 hypothetical protein DTL36_10420 [Bremerella cremea]